MTGCNCAYGSVFVEGTIIQELPCPRCDGGRYYFNLEEKDQITIIEIKGVDNNNGEYWNPFNDGHISEQYD